MTGRVGRMIEVYNPNPSMTFGGMGSKKLIGPNIEYIANNDSHPGAQFSSEFRNLVKGEIARISAEPAVMTAQARGPVVPALAFAENFGPRRSGDGTSALAHDTCSDDYGASACSSASARTKTSTDRGPTETGRTQAAILKS